MVLLAMNLLGPLVDNPVSFFLVSRQAHKGGGGGVSRPCAPLRQNRVCLTRGVSPGACPQGRVPRGVSPGACPQGRVPRGVSPGACPQGRVPRGVSPGACPQGRVPRGVSPGACPQGRVPRGVSPGACPQGRTGAYRGAQGRSLKNT